MASPSNNRGGSKRPTGGKAGGRAGKPAKPIAGTKDKTVRVPASWNAKTVDPTNNRGGNQRPTGGQAGGRAGKPSGGIARPPAKPAARPVGVTASYQMITNPTQNRGAGQRQTGGQAGGRAGRPSGAIARPKPASASVPRAVAGAAKGAGALRGGLIGAVGLAGADYLGRKAGEAIGTGLRNAANAPKTDKRSNRQGGRSTRTADKPTRPAQLSSTGIRVSDKANKRDAVTVPTGSQEYNDYRRKQIEAEKARLKNVGNPPARAVSPAASSSSSSRSGGGGSSARSTPAARPSQAPAKPGRKFEDFNPNRGTSKTNNPLMKDFVARMKDREDKAQASAASKLTIKSNVESGYEPKEKVDGSKVNAKGKIRSTVNEYDPKKRRYNG